MNKKIGYCFLAACQLLVGTGCTQTEVEEGRGVEDEGMEVQFRLSVLPENAPRTRSLHFTTTGCTEVDGLPATVGAGTPATRAGGLSEVEEEALNHLCIVQFNSRGAQVGSPIFFSSLENATVADGTTTLKVVIKKNPGKSTLYFLANAGDPSKTLSGKNEASFKEMVQAIAFTEAGMPRDGLCAMVGSWQGEATDELKSVELTRAVAKINFSYSISGTNDFSFTPTRLRLCNVPQQIHYVSSGAQPTAVDYTSYTALDFGTAASWCWYLPENQAGIAEGEGIATSDKEKTGVGVNNATYIELTGDAVQGTDLYPGVVFRLYPGSTDTDGYNDYNVNRNTSYTINITLTGIDFADKRVTVGEIPAMAKPDTLGARHGATIPFRLTSQPNKTGAFTLPDWLSAQIGETSFAAGTEVSYNNPVDVTFSTMSINPSDDPRDFTFRVDSTDVTVTQAGLVFLPDRQMLVMPYSNSKVKINVSDGVEWTLSRASGTSEITSETLSGTGTQELAFTATLNVAGVNAARSAYFILSTVGCDPERTVNIEVRQDPAVPTGSSSYDYQLTARATTPSLPWAEAIQYCADLSADGFGKGRWHLPSISELQRIWADRTLYSGAYSLASESLWSNEEVSSNTAQAYRFYYYNNTAQPYAKTSKSTFRCIRHRNSTGY